MREQQLLVTDKMRKPVCKARASKYLGDTPKVNRKDTFCRYLDSPSSGLVETEHTLGNVDTVSSQIFITKEVKKGKGENWLALASNRFREGEPGQEEISQWLILPFPAKCQHIPYFSYLNVLFQQMIWAEPLEMHTRTHLKLPLL